MHLLKTVIIAAFLFTSSIFAIAAPKFDRRLNERRNGVNFTTFEHAATGVQMEFVTNSGICETTRGVNQYSGYVSVGRNMSMWFWFFEARNSPSTAPLAMWFNGGPGSSSMIGLFVENGPCHFIHNQSTPSRNPYSFNNYANMLYVDQPIGTGFSYGIERVNSSITAAPDVWKLLQAFYTLFPAYENRDFGIFTESYGGSYGPTFAEYIQQQNSAIANGSAVGEQINLIALGINNGWFDPTLQDKAYIDYALNNSYKPMISATGYSNLTKIYNTECAPKLAKCNASGTNQVCSDAQATCGYNLEQPMNNFGSGFPLYDFDVYDIREPSNDPYPPTTYRAYLAQPNVTRAIGAKTAYQDQSDSLQDSFYATGDHARTTLPRLSNVVKSGVRVVLWAGDADFECNWFGVQAVAEAIDFPNQRDFNSMSLTNYTVNGTAGGAFKTKDNVSFLRVFNSGHTVPYYQPALALQVFEQTMNRQSLYST